MAWPASLVDGTDATAANLKTWIANPGQDVLCDGSISVKGSDGNFSAGGNRSFMDHSLGYTRFGSLRGGGAAVNGIRFFVDGGEGGKLIAEGAGRWILRTPNSAPVDADLDNSTISMYLDQAGNNLKVRVKYSDATLKTATIALT